MRRALPVTLTALLLASQPMARAQSEPEPTSPVRVEVSEEDEEPQGPSAEQDEDAAAPDAKPTPPPEPKPSPSPEPKPADRAGEQAASRATAPREEAPSRERADPEEAGDEEVVVVSATRTPQSIQEAPAIVTVITREEILALGYRSISEALRNVVGFDINDNLHWPDTGVRGINDRTTYGDKIQMLLDGHNMSWRQFNRNYHHPGWVAMEDIARVEVIRGPGSAIWGANALNGVVNIVTRDLSALDGAEFVFGMDHRFDHQFVSGRAGTTLGEHFKIGASIAYYSDDADALLAPVLEFDRRYGREVTVSGDQEEGITIALRARYRWFGASFHKIRQETGAPLSTFSILGGDDSRFTTDRHIARVSYEAMLLRGLELSAEVAFDDQRYVDGTAYESNPMAPGQTALTRSLVRMAAADRRWEFKVRTNYVPSLSLQVTAGVELEYLDLLRWHFPDQWAADGIDTSSAEFDSVHFGAFLQAQYAPVEMVAITVGLRLDYDQIYGLVLLYDYVPPPRLGVVLRLPMGFYFKGLFGMAYKAPSFHDLYYFRKNAYYGNPTLTPERSYTGELQVGYRYPGVVDVKVTGFYTHIDDLIGYAERNKDAALVSAGDFPVSQRPDKTKDYNQKVNKQFVTSMGGELEVLLQPHKRITIGLQGTYRRPRDHNGARLYYSARWVVGGSLSVRLHKHLQVTFRGLGVDNKQVKPRGLSEAGFPTWTEAQDPTVSAPAYFVGTFVLRAHDLIRDGIGLHLKLDNFTNGDHWDAGRELLYPQRRFQGMLWLTVKM